MRLFKRACGVGVSPNEFWDMEVADIVQYIEERSEELRRETYTVSILSAQFFAVTLGNAFRKEGAPPTPYPAYEEVFAMPTDEHKTPDELGEERLARRVADLRSQFAHRLPGGIQHG